MREKVCVFLIAMIAITSNVEALNFISGGIYYTNLMKQKNQIIPRIMPELLNPEERKEYELERDGVISISEGLIEYGLCKVLPSGGKEKVYIKIFHHREKEEPLVSVYDWLERDTIVTRKEIAPLWDYDIEMIESTPNDITFLWTETSSRKKDYIYGQGFVRAIYYNGRIFRVSHTLGKDKYTQEQKKKWIDRLENLSYMNTLANLSDQPEQPTAARSQTRRSKRRTSYRNRR